MPLPTELTTPPVTKMYFGINPLTPTAAYARGAKPRTPPGPRSNRLPANGRFDRLF